MKILFATDGSKYSDSAARFLGRFKFSQADEILVLYVIPKAPRSGGSYLKALMQLGEELAPMIVDESAGLFKDLGANVSTLVTRGHPADAILAAGRRSASDLIVMGNRGMKAVGSFLLGSVTRAVVINSEQSVLVIKPSPGKQDGPLNVLFPTDGSACAEETEKVLSLIPFYPETSLTAVYVLPSTYMDIPERFYPGMDERLNRIAEGMRLAEVGHAEKVLDQARNRLREKFRNTAVLIRNGDPSDQILQAARETRAEIIALGSRGMRGFSGMLGSVARNILGHADCSVLVCRRGDTSLRK